MSTAHPVFSKGRDLTVAAAAIREWLAVRLGVPSVDVEGLRYPEGAGVSNETILFDARWTDDGVHREKFVLRISPRADYQMFYRPRFRMQYDLLVALREHGAPRVPDVLWFEDDLAVLGQPFFLMRAMVGRVPVSMPVYNSVGWLFDATPNQRRTVWLSAMEQFSAIHRVPVGLVGFLDQPEYGASGLEQQLGYWREFAEWSLGDAAPADLTDLLERLAATAPETVNGLSWGDARMGNIMFDDEGQVLGVMDWEQASLAGGLSDLGWWLLFDDVHSHDYGVSRLDGLGSRAETISLWESSTGLSADGVEWHEAFAGAKAGLLSLHSRSLMNVSLGEADRNIFLDRGRRILGLSSGLVS